MMFDRNLYSFIKNEYISYSSYKISRNTFVSNKNKVYKNNGVITYYFAFNTYCKNYYDILILQIKLLNCNDCNLSITYVVLTGISFFQRYIPCLVKNLIKFDVVI